MKSLLVADGFVVSGSPSMVHQFLLCSSRQDDQTLDTFRTSSQMETSLHLSDSWFLLGIAVYCFLIHHRCHSKASLGMISWSGFPIRLILLKTCEALKLVSRPHNFSPAWPLGFCFTSHKSLACHCEENIVYVQWITAIFPLLFVLAVSCKVQHETGGNSLLNFLFVVPVHLCYMLAWQGTYLKPNFGAQFYCLIYLQCLSTFTWILTPWDRIMSKSPRSGWLLDGPTHSFLSSVSIRLWAQVISPAVEKKTQNTDRYMPVGKVFSSH